MAEILKHVDVLDLIKIKVYRPNIYKFGQIAVDIEALEKGKRVVIDTKALAKLNNIVNEKCKEFDDARDPKVVEYLKEFIGRMCSEWGKMGLLVIEDMPDAPEDPYKAAR